jgi:acetolactate synthase I/II/III large subunit
MSEITGGALLAETLHTLGVRDVFTLHGGHLDTFLVACPGVGIRLIDMRHEASAGHAAEAYARLKPGQVGVAVVTAGPGFTNAITAMANAFLNGVPTLFIGGAPPMSEEATNELQGTINQVALATPVTKWAQRIATLERLPDLVEKAMRVARSGRPGPVYLELPINLMFGRSAKVFFPVQAGRAVNSRPAPTKTDALRVLGALARAERPLIIAGTGVVLSDASAALLRFVEATGIPVVTNSKAHGVLPSAHPAYAGAVGAVAAARAEGLAPDLVLLAGARAGLLTGGRTGAIIPKKESMLIQIDIDGGEMGRITPVDIPIVADCAAAFEVLTEHAGHFDWPSRAEWAGALKAQRDTDRAFADAPKTSNTGAIHPYHAAKAVFEATPLRAIIAVDGGEITAWCEPHNKVSAPGHYLTTGYFGTLGVGPGFAIAAAVACPDRPVVLLSGDGAIGFNIQEFDTMVRHKLPIITVVMNNACWGISKSAQDLIFGEGRRSAVMLNDTAYDQVAVGFGCYGERVTSPEEIGPAIKRALKSKLPACINIVTDQNVVHPISFGMAGADPKKGKITMPYYQNE